MTYTHDNQWCRIIRLGALLLSAWCAMTFARADTLTVQVSQLDTQAFPQVTCRVNVITNSGDSLTGLTATAFTVTENETPARDLRCQSRLPGNETLAVACALDCSFSMKGAPLDAAKQAIGAFTREMGATDLLTLVPFSGTVTAPAAPNADKTAALKQLAAATARGKTALFDALQTADATLAGVPTDRKALVLLTDGFDTSSAAAATQALDSAKKAGIAVYVIGLGRAVNTPFLTRLTTETGGFFYQQATPDQLTAIYRRIARQLHSAYLLTFTSPVVSARDGSHTLRIRVQDSAGVGEAMRQYLAPTRKQTEAGGLALPPAMLAVLALLLVNVCLAVGVIIRYRRRIGSP